MNHTEQEIRQTLFNNAWNGLKAQGWEKSTYGTKCLYRGPGGRKCAIGFSIGDDEYDPKLEGVGAAFPKIMNLCELKSTNGNMFFIGDLQECHDDATSPEDMQKRMRAFAEAYDCIIPDEPEQPQ